MSEILGTTVSIKSYLSPNKIELTIKEPDRQPLTINLVAERKYIIPDFQREIRWDENNLNTLLYDLSNGSKFLGNIILAIAENKCEIIDGQQRTTILLLILNYIRYKYGNELDISDVCKLENENMPGFSILMEKHFSPESLMLDEVVSSDAFNQRERYQKLWNEISESQYLNSSYNAKTILGNIYGSTINIIASYKDEQNKSVRYFLDVNLKGVHLDTEDIFKGYLFSNDSRPSTYTSWKNLKKAAFDFNKAKRGSEDGRYPFMKVWEHYFYCDLYQAKPNLSNVNFNESFELTKAEKISNDKCFSKGTHLLDLINDKTYILNAINRLTKALKIMEDIITSERPDDFFKSLFICSTQLDSVFYTSTHRMLQTILLDKDVVPKILALKYILTYLDGRTHAKKEYSSIFSVYSAAELFIIFASKKDGSKFYNFVRNDQWIDKIEKYYVGFLKSPELSRGKLRASYKCSDFNSEDYAYESSRCKALAAMNNFIRIRSEGRIQVNDKGRFSTFFSDSSSFSTEHFLIPSSGKLHFSVNGIAVDYPVPSQIKRFRNSLFNYLFIPKTMNAQNDNTPPMLKACEYQEKTDQIQCAYSKQYLTLFNSGEFFTKYPTTKMLSSCTAEDEIKQMLDSYFNDSFAEEYFTFSTVLLDKICNTIISEE